MIKIPKNLFHIRLFMDCFVAKASRNDEETAPIRRGSGEFHLLNALPFIPGPGSPAFASLRKLSGV